MAKTYKIYIWKTAPFLRLLIPLIAGVILQYYFASSFRTIIISGSILIALITCFRFLPLAYRVKRSALQGIFITLLIVCVGMLLTWHKDIRNEKAWYGHYFDSSSFIIATIKEPSVEKAKSYKALATVDFVVNGDTAATTTGDVLLYLAKVSGMKALS